MKINKSWGGIGKTLGPTLESAQSKSFASSDEFQLGWLNGWLNIDVSEIVGALAQALEFTTNHGEEQFH